MAFPNRMAGMVSGLTEWVSNSAEGWSQSLTALAQNLVHKHSRCHRDVERLHLAHDGQLGLDVAQFEEFRADARLLGTHNQQCGLGEIDIQIGCCTLLRGRHHLHTALAGKVEHGFKVALAAYGQPQQSP